MTGNIMLMHVLASSSIATNPCPKRRVHLKYVFKLGSHEGSKSAKKQMNKHH
jgi:hypothetical protein